MKSSIGKIGRRLSVFVVFALAMTGATAASAGATVPMWEFTFPEVMVPSGGKVVIETSTNVVTCTSTSGSGEVSGFRSNLQTLRFTGCTAEFGEVRVGKCSSAGLAEGEITTKSLVATLEYISKASHEVGLIFNHGGGTSTVASFKCPATGTSGSIRGEFMAKITPINTLTAEFPLALKGTKGVQELTQFENEKGEKVTLSTFGMELSEGAFKNASISTTGLALKLSKGARITA